MLLFGLVFGVFLPATQNAFVSYDDLEYVTDNPYVQRGLTGANLIWAFTSGYAVNWHPLTWLSHMADVQLYGLQPAGHHLTSILLHALNATLLFLLLHRMTGATGRSLLVAALFGLHPLRVESVAWVAERKDVLSALFFLLTILAYVQYVQQAKSPGAPARRYLAWALVAFALGLMSKPMLVTLPFVLLLLDYWPLRRAPLLKSEVAGVVPPSAHRSRASLWIALRREKWPFFLLAAAASVVTFYVQQHSGAVMQSLPLIARVENALVSYARYLGKLFWPADLAVLYPHPLDWPTALVGTCGVALLTMTIFLTWQARRHPVLAVGWFWYLGMLVPVIGLVQVGSQSIADRYTYLPTIGILVLTVWGLHELAGRTRPGKIILTVTGIATLLACATLTLRQISRWQDSETLFRHTLAVTKNNPLAHDSLGGALLAQGRGTEAMQQYQTALRLNAADTVAHNGMGVLLMQRQDFAAAERHLREALRLNPNDAFAHGNLGVLLAQQGALDEAISHLQHSVNRKPHNAEAQNNLGSLLLAQGRGDEALRHFRAAVNLKPDYAKARKNLGTALVKQGQWDEAIAQFREAVRLQPDLADAREKLQAALELKAAAAAKP